MSATIATDSNLSATGTITLSLDTTIPASPRYSYWASSNGTSITISSLAAGTYAFLVTLVTNDAHSSGITVSVSGASALAAFPVFAISGSGSPQLGQSASGLYSVSTEGNVTFSLSNYSGIFSFTAVAFPVTT